MKLLRTWARGAIPLQTRQVVAHQLREWRDALHGVRLADSRMLGALSDYTLHAEITQPIMPGALFENKLANISRAAQRLNLSLIPARQTWSFWRYIQQPNEKNGYVVGRNLVNGELTRQVGGGLCQISSMLYHLGLLAGLTIAERHSHSIDIYQEHERFTPLGADATVVWGYKDLRMTNSHTVDIVLECFVHQHFLTGRVYARGPLPKCDVQFAQERVNLHQVMVNTTINQQQVSQTVYQQKQGLGLQPHS